MNFFLIIFYLINEIKNDEVQWESLRFKYQINTDEQNQKEYLDQFFQVSTNFLSRYFLLQRMNASISFLGIDYYDVDMVILINTTNLPSETWWTKSKIEKYLSLPYRPIVGTILWNTYYTKFDSIDDSEFEKNVQIALGSITHLLGFNNVLFPFMIDSVKSAKSGTPLTYSNTVQTVDGVIYLTTPRLKQFIKNHFGCENASGVPLENNGGSGYESSHFEKNSFYNDITTGYPMAGNMIISDLIFLFFQDQGYYNFVDYIPDQLVWGKNRGCEFLYKKCTDLNNLFPEFCSIQNEESCSYLRTGVSQCESHFLSGGCKFRNIKDQYDCRDANSKGGTYNQETFQYFGSDSMCIDGSISKSQTIASLQKYSCLKYTCDLRLSRVTLYIDGITFECVNPGPIKLPDGYYGNIECPKDAAQFCQNQDECLNQCSQKGYCMNKQCICIPGYAGKGCQDICSGYRYKDKCVGICPQNTYSLELTQYCVRCPANCAICSNYNKCTQCLKGYYLNQLGFCDNYYDINHTIEENTQIEESYQTIEIQISFKQLINIMIIIILI